jgi:pimeloyl-ACP methyl ester carboxylesterase
MERMPIVCIAGLLSDSRVFSYQEKHLKEICQTSVVTTLDCATPDAMVQKVLAAAPPRFSLFGHSIGGWVALKLMKMAPERVEKLCILSTGVRKATSLELDQRQKGIERIERGEFEEVAEEIADRFTYNGAVRDEVLAMFLEAGAEAFLNQTRAMMMREDLLESLSKISCPTLLIHASQDGRFSEKDLREIKETIPHSKWAIVEDAGHMSPMERPDEVTRLVRDLC